MKIRTLGMVLVGASGAATSIAMADEVDVRWNRGGGGKEVQTVTPRDLAHIPGRSASTFGDRATITVQVYDLLSNIFNTVWGTLPLISHTLDDIDFTGGVYGPSYTGTRTISGIGYGYALINGTASWDHRFSLYLPSDVSFAGFSGDNSGMINPNATPFYTLTITGFDTNICPGFGTVSPLTNLPTPLTLPAGTTSLYIDQALVEPGTPGTAPLTSTNLFQANITTEVVSMIIASSTNALMIDTNPTTAGVQPPTGPQTEAFLAAAGNPASVGRNHPQYGRDSNFSAVYLGQSLVNQALGAGNERRYVSFTRTIGNAFRLWGEVEAPAPVAAESLNIAGSLPDGATQIFGTLTSASPFKWYKFNVPTDINYTNVKFLDVDTEGSDQPVAFAIYTPNSAVFNIAESRGSGPDAPPSEDGNNAYQLSYGVARRPGVNNGEQYSGQEGVMPAGEYYLIVAPSGAGFGDGWATNAATAANINYTLSLNGNPVSLAAGPAVPPLLQVGGDLGILVGGAQVVSDLAVRTNGIGWVRFGLTNNLPTIGAIDERDGVTPLSDVTFLDITQPGSDVVGEWNFALYNNNGILANASSVSASGAGFNGNNGGGDGPFGCGGTFAQLSYGTAPSRGTTALDAGQSTFGRELNNQNGSALANDEYYLAVTMGTILFANERWGARSTRGNDLLADITVNSNNRGPSTLCPADFNGDFVVNDADFTIFARAYNNITDLVGDLNFDTLSDDADFSVFATAYDAILCP